MPNLNKLLEYAMKGGASDVHLAMGSPPAIRKDGKIRFLEYSPITPLDFEKFLKEMMTTEQRKNFEQSGDADLAFSVPDLGRFRVNVLKQRGSVGIVLRLVSSDIKNFTELHLPPILATISDYERGLVLVTGTTGSGKSTTLASCIDYINQRKRIHIVTLEDPIEFLHPNKKALVTQREINIDTRDFKTALRAVMREDPDVILIGEMRDAETFQAAISASETGHMVFATLHTTNAMMTIDRIIDMFPGDLHDQIRSQLALQLKAIISQRLIRDAEHTSRVPAVEVLINNPGIAQLIRENLIKQIPMAIASGKDSGMQSFNMSLHAIIKSKLCREEDAILASDNPEELKMLLAGIQIAQNKGGILRRS